ncbi:sigma-70 family RNA polymerase sigma factor, partial [Streptomyces aureus]
MNTTAAQPHEVLVLGAGYAGLSAAIQLAARTRKRANLRVTLVNPYDTFTERLRLHMTATGQETAEMNIQDLLDGTGAVFVRGWVTAVDADAKTVRVDDNRLLRYDTLVYALGSIADTVTVPGADGHAHTLDGPQDAALLAGRLSGLDAGTVVVAGSGLTGVEAAAEIAEQHPDLQVLLLGRREPGFQTYRTLLFSVAYRLLGTAAHAEDVVQDAWLKWSAADRSQVADPKAYLARIVSNLAMERLRSTRHQRETYVGPWLPEPILTGPDVADTAAAADAVSMALLVVLETLSPLERAVFVLKEAFAFSYAEIAEAVERSEEAVRQAAHRAREHVQARRPRYPADPARRRDVTERFFAASTGGDINTLIGSPSWIPPAWRPGRGYLPLAGEKRSSCGAGQKKPVRPLGGSALSVAAVRLLACICGIPSGSSRLRVSA